VLVYLVVVQSLYTEFHRNPTELNHSRVEQKLQVMQRLKSQLSNAGTPTIFDGQNVSNSSAANIPFRC